MDKGKNRRPGKLKVRYILLALLVLALLVTAAWLLPFGPHDLLPHDTASGATASGAAATKTPAFALDPASPWPKFRANALQNGRSPVLPRVDAAARPWTFQTGKGIFSSPVVDAEGTVYVGSADHFFYAIRRDGSLAWKFETGEIIDSSALLDDRGRVYLGSGDQHVYCLDRATGTRVWSFKAHSPEEVTRDFKVKTRNVAWFEGNIGMLPDGTILAPDDNCLVYALDRGTGARTGQYAGNEMVWSLPAVNARTGRLFFGTTFLAAKTVFAYDAASGKRLWNRGGLGSVAATCLLTSDSPRGAVVVGGFDGYVRALAQDSGKQLWAFGARDHIYASPAQLADGTIIQPAADGTVYALDPRTGRQRWAFDTREPIRSSPAVGGDGRIYVGSGEGRLYCLEPDGRLRWSYLCIEDDRNDLNASPALGADGVYIAGESGGVFFVPYDYPLSAAGRADPRCRAGSGSAATASNGEDLPPDGALLLPTTRFGALLDAMPATLAANEPVTLSLFVRKGGDTVLSAIDRDSVKVEATGSPGLAVSVAANRRFLTIAPREAWTGPSGGKLRIEVKADYSVGLSRFGLKFFGGRRGGSLAQAFEVQVPPRAEARMPYALPGETVAHDAKSPNAVSGTSAGRTAQAQTVFEFSRLAAPNPTMLPSWNQIGFDSLHYLAGLVARLPSREGRERALVWVVGGRPEGGKTVVDPSLEARYPLVLEWDSGLITFHNYDGFKINFIGSWDMPFGSYRLASRADPAGGAILSRVSFSAVALCDQIPFYGLGLKLMGMSESDSGKMAVSGGMNLSLWDGAGRSGPVDAEGRAVPVGEAVFSLDAKAARVELKGSGLGKESHVYSLVLADAASGEVLPLYYTKDTKAEYDGQGRLASLSVALDPRKPVRAARAYLMVDTWPAAQADIAAEGGRK